ncbi:TRAP transporter substrate-binding protein [Rhodobacteraceae bacterium RKSG542]|uniref:TRAP transporter substrate-binding protein n=1 Tax=Pseudovibrio flavus TaxID=2529854 RepID=UPI0012BD30B0|nr:TRAP transporter substrate-binding protein [Pseudovibrio flavus]MTI15924.1 TRAP transporter substrate-binding protein [Pseudovibrio flavus]
MTKHSLTRRTMLASIGGALAAPAFLTRAKAAEVTLRLQHFLPPVAPMHKVVLVPWAKKIIEASNGAIDIQIFPSMQLGGKPPQLADQARQGIVDITWTLPVYTPERFPVAETMSLPFLVTNAEKSSVVMHKIMDEFGSKEYRGLKPLAFHMHDGGKFHMRDTPIDTKADLAGKRIRSPNKNVGEMLAALGAEPVFFPVTEMVVGLSNGVIDGCCLPYEVVPAFKLQELTNVTSEPAAGTRGLYGNTFALVMNERSYEGLPDDLRSVIDENSGIELSRSIGESFDKFEAFGRGVVEKAGNTINEIATSEIDSWRSEAEPLYLGWKQKLEAKGHDGDAILGRINELLDASAG